MSDSVSLRQDSYYDTNGITAISNNSAVVLRDQGGNVLVQPTSSLLVIEAITTNVLAESVLPLLNTQFNYFKFPARLAVIDESLDLNLDLDLNLNLESELNTIAETVASESIILPLPSKYQPSANQRIPVGSWANPTVLEFSKVVTGPAQIEPNTLVVTQKLLDQLDELAAETGKTAYLQVTGVIKTVYNKNTTNSGIGFSMGFANSSRRATMSSPDADLKEVGSGNDRFKRAKKENTYTTEISFYVGLGE